DQQRHFMPLSMPVRNISDIINDLWHGSPSRIEKRRVYDMQLPVEKGRGYYGLSVWLHCKGHKALSGVRWKVERWGLRPTRQSSFTRRQFS
ncbi:MAG: hypothetical protein WCI11_14615, partial [Candidatus Methylumidiphilus sp.]